MSRHPFYAEFPDDLRSFIAAIPPRERFAPWEKDDTNTAAHAGKDFTANFFFPDQAQQEKPGFDVYFQQRHVAAWTHTDQPDPMAGIPQERLIPFAVSLFWMAVMEQAFRDLRQREGLSLSLANDFYRLTMFPSFVRVEDDQQPTRLRFISPHYIPLDINSRLPPYERRGRPDTRPEVYAAVEQSVAVVPDWCRQFVANNLPEMDADKFFYGMNDIVARWIPPHFRKTP